MEPVRVSVKSISTQLLFTILGVYMREGIAKEADVMSVVDQWLTVHGIPHWRMNTGACRNKQGRIIRFGAAGMSDFYAIGKDGRSIWIECKRPKGGRVSESQRAFMRLIREHGGVAIIVSDLTDLEVGLQEMV